MSSRPELEKYIGEEIMITARLTSRADGGQYGFLLEDIMLPSGEQTDHAWLRFQWLDLATVSGHEIRALASVSTYWKACRVYGKYVEDGEEGTGFDDLSEVEVRINGEWLPLKEAATHIRKRRINRTAQAKAAGMYVWPGAWTYATGSLAVKAAKSAPAGSTCAVKGRNPWHDRAVILTEQVKPGIWKFEEIAPAKKEAA